jgi:N-acetylglutamate synthase/N-acetylornithine aminotransferase
MLSPFYRGFSFGRCSSSTTFKEAVDFLILDLSFAGAPVMKRGKIVPHYSAKIRSLMEVRDIPIQLDLNLGTAEATAWGCDLTHGYVVLNVSDN